MCWWPRLNQAPSAYSDSGWRVWPRSCAQAAIVGLLDRVNAAERQGTRSADRIALQRVVRPIVLSISAHHSGIASRIASYGATYFKLK